MQAETIQVRAQHGRIVEHEAVGRWGQRLHTRDADGVIWRWILPTGLCVDTPFARLVDPAAAARVAREGQLAAPGVTETQPRQGVMW